MTAPTTGVATDAHSACDPTQIAGGEGAGQNGTANTTTTRGEGGGSNATSATTGTMTANATTADGGGNQTTSSPTQLIEQACIAALNNDTQALLMNLNSALNTLGGNTTTAADGEGEAE